MKKKALFIAILIALVANTTYAQLNCPVDSCDNFSNYFLNTGSEVTGTQDAINRGYYYVIDQSKIQGPDTTVCYAFIEPAQADLFRQEIFVSYQSCPGDTLNYRGFGPNLTSNSGSNNGFNMSTVTSSFTSGGLQCVKGSFTGNWGGAPNEIQTTGTFQYQYPAFCSKFVASTLNIGPQCLTVGETYKHCIKIVKSTVCPGNIIISPIIKCNGGCVPLQAKPCNSIDYIAKVNDVNCKGNGSIELTVCTNRKFKFLWNDLDSNQNRVNLPAGTYTVKITDTESKNCDTTGSFVINTLPNPTVTISTSGKSSVCITGVTTLTAMGGTGLYTWSTGDTGSTLVINPTGTATYTVVSDTGKCRATGSITVTPGIAPSIQLSALSPTLTCAGVVYPLQAITDQTVYTYWDFGDGTTWTSPTATPPNTPPNPDPHTFSFDGFYHVVVVAMNPPCSDTAEINVSTGRVYVDLLPANVFTPNADGRNDCYHPAINLRDMNLTDKPEDVQNAFLQCTDMEIYDRWGMRMFKSTDTVKCWDGKTESGHAAKEGTYYYVAHLENITLKGFVELIR